MGTTRAQEALTGTTTKSNQKFEELLALIENVAQERTQKLQELFNQQYYQNKALEESGDTKHASKPIEAEKSNQPEIITAIQEHESLISRLSDALINFLNTVKELVATAGLTINNAISTALQNIFQQNPTMTQQQASSVHQAVQHVVNSEIAHTVATTLQAHGIPTMPQQTYVAGPTKSAWVPRPSGPRKNSTKDTEYDFASTGRSTRMHNKLDMLALSHPHLAGELLIHAKTALTAVLFNESTLKALFDISSGIQAAAAQNPEFIREMQQGRGHALDVLGQFAGTIEQAQAHQPLPIRGLGR